MKGQNIGLALFMTFICLIGSSGLATSAEFGNRFSDRSLRGEYGYSFEADFGTGLANKAVEAGVFAADGQGRLIGSGTAVTNGLGPIEVTYDCTYSVPPDGRALVECDRTTPITGTLRVNFLLVLAARSREAYILGIPTVPPFDIIRLIGSAIKQ